MVEMITMPEDYDPHAPLEKIAKVMAINALRIFGFSWRSATPADDGEMGRDEP